MKFYKTTTPDTISTLYSYTKIEHLYQRGNIKKRNCLQNCKYAHV